MAFKEIVGKLNEAGRSADAVLEEFRADPAADAAALAEAIRRYAAAKLRLEDNEVSDNITVMVRYNISRASGIPVEKLKEMDRPGACGSAPAVLAQRILLFLDIQKKLGAAMDPKDAQHIQTVQDLAEVLYPLYNKDPL